MICSTCPGSSKMRPRPSPWMTVSVTCSPTSLRSIFSKPPEHLLEAAEHLVEVEEPRLERLLSTEREELPCQVRSPSARDSYLLDVIANGIARHEPVDDERRVAEDDREDVVEVVGDAAGELPDRVHLLRLAELILQSPPVVDVLERAADAHDFAGGVGLGVSDRADPKALAGRRDDLNLRVERRTVSNAGLDRASGRLEKLRGTRSEGLRGYRRRPDRELVHREELLGPADSAAGKLHAPAPDLGRLAGHAQLGLAVAELRLGGALFDGNP